MLDCQPTVSTLKVVMHYLFTSQIRLEHLCRTSRLAMGQGNPFGWPVECSASTSLPSQTSCRRGRMSSSELVVAYAVLCVPSCYLAIIMLLCGAMVDLPVQCTVPTWTTQRLSC